MLVEIRCDKFRTESISFHKGLNVVLGDENATNSIGKSSLLMVIDFACGGNSLLTYNTDIVQVHLSGVPENQMTYPLTDLFQ